jgi:hypothetical protein
MCLCNYVHIDSGGGGALRRGAAQNASQVFINTATTERVRIMLLSSSLRKGHI